MKIVFFISNIANSGTERFLNVLESYLQLKNETKIVYFGENKQLYDFKSPIEKLDVPMGNSIMAESSRRLKLRGFIKKENPDLMISFGEGANIDVAMASMSLDKKLIITEHSKTAVGKPASMRNFAYKKADMLTVLNQVEFDSFDFMKDRRMVVHPPFALPIVEGKKERIILSVGRLEPIKGYENYFKALSKVPTSIRDGWEICLAGTGSLENKLKDMTKYLGISVSFLGHRKDIENYYARASIVALPSIDETLPNALIEAVFYDCARFATPTNGAKELIRDGYDGILSKDFSIDAMKEGLETLLASQEKREALAAKAKLNAHKYKVETFYKTWDEIIAKVTGTNS